MVLGQDGWGLVAGRVLCWAGEQTTGNQHNNTTTHHATQPPTPPQRPLNAFTSFLDDCGIPDADSASVKRSDCDTVFIVANFVADKRGADYAVLDEHASMRFQFLEAVVRLGAPAEGGALLMG